MYNQVAYNRQITEDKGKRRRLRLLMLALIGFLCWAGLTLWNQEGRLNLKFSQLSVLEGKLETSKKANQKLKLEITRLNDPEYIEQRARKDYHMTRPGETLFIKPKTDE